MSYLSPAQAALAAGHTVFLEKLVFLDFEDGAVFAWTGFGDLILYGETWIGAGLIGSIGDLPVTMNDAAGKVDLSLSGVSPEIVALAKDSAAVRGRDATLWGQMFNEDLQPAETRFFLPPKVRMDVMSFSMSGPSQRTISLSLESIFTGRNSAVQAFFSDRDQQIRSPGDKGLERMSTLVPGKRVTWPRFS